MADGRARERNGDYETAAETYKRIVRDYPDDRDAVKRLLMVYRKLKDFRNELLTIEAAIGTVALKDQSAQGKWLSANPQAAKLGKAMLKSLGGAQATAYGTDPFVQELLKRKDLVERKISGRKTVKTKKKREAAKKNPGGKTNPQIIATQRKGILKGVPEKQHAADRQADRMAAKENRREEAAAAKARVRKKMEADAKIKEEVAEKAKKALAVKGKKDAAAKAKSDAAAKAKKEVVAIERKQTAEARRAEKLADKLKTEKMAQAKTAASPSFFIINLRYLAPLSEIDGAMSKHVRFLDKYFAGNLFLVAGRQVPRTGGIIIARGKDRQSVDRIMRQDPFIKEKLASYDIVEFKGSRTSRAFS